jgi:cytochrome c oxidase cbb3-type subunit III
MTTFWSCWIIFFTAATIIGAWWLLFANRKGSRGADQTTGHSYDGIEEYDNPLPAWWFYLFVATIIFGVGYLVAFPGFGSFAGVLGWTQQQQWQNEVKDADATYGPLFAKYAAMPIEEVVKDTQALKMGQRLFANNCAVCHGSAAQGSFGFPNLTDNDWLYGGSPDVIKTTIMQGRRGAMPAWQQILGDDGIANVVAYVSSLSGHNTGSDRIAAGESLFKTMCVACHGIDGKGSIAMGAPNLTDNIWLYGGSPGQIKHTLVNGRNGTMPAHGDLLGNDRIHLVAAYVYSLSHDRN